MKNIIYVLCTFLVMATSIYGQQEKGIVGKTNWLNTWTEFNPSKEYYGEPTQIITGNITTDTKLYKRETYLLLGSVFVTNGATLTIEPGTVILGDYKTKGSLIVSKGSFINAKGTVTDPIIFTSNRSVKRPGDWGGVIILGDAPVNRFGSGSIATYYPNINPANYAYGNYGGEELKDSSGVFQYVRIEYSGKRVSEDIYFSGLLLAGVGEESTFNNVMVSQSAGNAFEVWGGKPKMNQFVSYKSHGSDFIFNYGSRSNLQNSLAIRSPFTSNDEIPRCLELLSYNKKEECDFSKEMTLLAAENLTFINISEDLESHIKMNLINEAVYIGENASLNMSKTVISGFNPAVILQDGIVLNQANLEKINFSEMFFNKCNGNIFLENNTNNDDLENWYGNSSFFNVYSKGSNAETFIDIKNERRPDFRLRINKIIAANDNLLKGD